MMDDDGTNAAAAILDFPREISREEFKHKCLLPNRPAIIRNISCKTTSEDSPAHDNSPSSNQNHLLSTDRMKDYLISVLLNPENFSHRVPVVRITPAKMVKEGGGGGQNVADNDNEGIPQEAEDGRNYDCTEMSVKEWLDEICTTPDARRQPSVTEEKLNVGLYLKDWHFQREFEERVITAATAASNPVSCSSADLTQMNENEKMYIEPDWLGGDWLTPFCLAQRVKLLEREKLGGSEVDTPNTDIPVFGTGDDYRFAYLGLPGKYSRTPFHFDVFGSYSWSYNIQGYKRWYFVSPATEEAQKLMYDFYPSHRERPESIHKAVEAVNKATGGGSYLQSQTRPVLSVDSVVQGPGELVFVPSCYFHEVRNIVISPSEEEEEEEVGDPEEEKEGERGDDHRASGKSSLPSLPAMNRDLCISINHNWCNEYNITRMANLLVDEIKTIDQLTDEESKRVLKIPPSAAAPTEQEAGVEGGGGGADHTNTTTDWEVLVNRMLKGSGAWDVPSFLALLNWAEEQVELLEESKSSSRPREALSTLHSINEAREMVVAARKKYIQSN